LDGDEALNHRGGPVRRRDRGLLRGDPTVSGGHPQSILGTYVIVLPWMAFMLLAFHFTLVRHGIVSPERHAAIWSGRFFPVTCCDRSWSRLVCAAVVTAPCSSSSGGDPANPPDSGDGSPHLVVVMSRAPSRTTRAWFAGFTLLALGLAVVPLFDRRPERSLRGRPVVTTLGVVFFLSLVAAWMAGRNLRSAPFSATLGRQAVEEPMTAPAPLGPAAPRPAATGDTSGAREAPP
jgi:hypothetical protein